MFWFGDVCMYLFIGEGVKNSIDIMVEATGVNTIGFTYLKSCTVVVEMWRNNMPMHPIVSACGTATYNTAKFITKILQNYCGKTSSFVKDTTDFIKKIKHLSINAEEETLVSFDVSALFTSIPVPVALQVINSKIST